MANLVLYRKYRPKTFKEVVGQEHVVRTLTNAIKENILSHGYLFSGPHGSGKTTIARLLAKSLNCLNRKQGEFEPCNACSSCLEINQGNAIDLIEIDAASNRGIDEIRDLKEGIRFQPAKSKYKVFVVDECHQMTKEAANALLKTLEEPPSHALFILATTEVHKMIPTILSRCQRFDFRRLTLEEIKERLKGILKKEGVDYEKEALDLIAASSFGALRDAETLLDEAITFSEAKEIKKETVRVLLGTADRQSILKLIELLKEKKAKEAIDFLNEIIFKGIDLKEFAKSLIQYLRDLLLLKIDSSSESISLTKEEREELINLAKSFSETEIKEAIESFMEAENKMKYASLIQLPLELAIIDLCSK